MSVVGTHILTRDWRLWAAVATLVVFATTGALLFPKAFPSVLHGVADVGVGLVLWRYARVLVAHWESGAKMAAPRSLRWLVAGVVGFVVGVGASEVAGVAVKACTASENVRGTCWLVALLATSVIVSSKVDGMLKRASANAPREGWHSSVASVSGAPARPGTRMRNEPEAG
jgi:hypothetical protein